MKLITTLILFLSFRCFAQNEANIWYFGQQAGVDFNSGTPVALTNCSPSFAAFEGVGTLSDATGNLLFYTDGNTVFNANHVAMPNGTGLLSNSSSTQTGLSVKQPGSATIYYVFHINISAGQTLYYSTVDMSLNGGLGDVVQKNVVLRTNTTEKVTGIFKSNGTDIWILTHDFSSNSFVAFLLTSTGLNTIPVISNTGQIYTDAIGYLKASPQANKLASADFGMSTYSIYDFDNSTGMVSNPNVSPASYLYAYGCEWSPDGTKLYGGQENSNSLWQFDLNSANVWSSATLIFQTSSQEYEAMQLGPDGKIYTSRYQTAWLGVVNDPNAAGLACNYDDFGVDLLGRYCYLGLPSYNMSIFNGQPTASFGAMDTALCAKFCIDFFDSSANNPVSWQWSFPGGGPSSSTSQNPSNICYQSPGVFDVTLIVTNANGVSDTFTHSNYITVYANPVAPSITQTGNLLTSSTASTYQWQLNLLDIPGATNQTYTITGPGLYTVVITNENGCGSQSSIDATMVGVDEVSGSMNVEIFPNPSSGLFNVDLSATNKINVQLSVVKALGQLVSTKTESLASGHLITSIDLRNFAAGIYFLEIKADDAVIQNKLICY